MKKILSVLSAISILSSSSSAVVSCSSDLDVYNSFKSYLKDKQSFVYLLSANDCPKCQSSILKVFNPINGAKGSDPSLSWNSIIKNNLTYSPETVYPDQQGASAEKKAKIMSARTAYTNMKFHMYEQHKVADVYNDSSVKKIIDWVIKQSEQKAKQTGSKKYEGKLTKKDLGISAVPLWIFVDQGTYQGFYQGEIDNIIPNTKSSPNLMNRIFQQIVHHNWKITGNTTPSNN